MEPKAMVAGDLRQDPVVLEQIAECRAAIFDRTGTLAYGAEAGRTLIALGFTQKEGLTLVASLERYSKQPLARAILAATKADGIPLPGGHGGGRAARPGPPKEQICQDLVEIMTVFCSKIYGHRSRQHRK
jgi:cation transport ATPase